MDSDPLDADIRAIAPPRQDAAYSDARGHLQPVIRDESATVKYADGFYAEQANWKEDHKGEIAAVVQARQQAPVPRT